MFNVLRNVEILTFAKIKCARNLLICVLVEIPTFTKVTIDTIIAFIQRLCKYKLNKIKFDSKNLNFKAKSRKLMFAKLLKNRIHKILWYENNDFVRSNDKKEN